MAGSKRNKIKNTLSPSSANNIDQPEDDGLLDDLIAQIDSQQPTDKGEAATVINQLQNSGVIQTDLAPSKKSNRSRFEARQSRKAAENAQKFDLHADDEADARMQEEIKAEQAAIKTICNEYGLTMHEINPDGHCLFSAIADQLHILNILPPESANYYATRQAASQYIYAHPDDFLPFLPSVDGEDGLGSTSAGLMSDEQLQQYCLRIRDTGAWGGEPEILALSRAYNIPINVAQTGNPPIVVHSPNEASTDSVKGKRAVWISYHRRMYGLGEHYNSLRPKVASESVG